MASCNTYRRCRCYTLDQSDPDYRIDLCCVRYCPFTPPLLPADEEHGMRFIWQRRFRHGRDEVQGSNAFCGWICDNHWNEFNKPTTTRRFPNGTPKTYVQTRFSSQLPTRRPLQPA